MKKLLFAVLITLFISGIDSVRSVWCGQATWPPEYREKVTTRIYDANYDKVFDAVVNACLNKGYPVIIKNKENGVILTDYVTGGGPVALGREKLDFTITKVDENSTKVRLYIHYDFSGANTDRNIDNYIDEDYYGDFFKAIQKELDQAAQSQSDSNQSSPNYY